MFLPKNKGIYLLLMILFSVLASTTTFAKDKRELHSMEKMNNQAENVISQVEDDNNVPTVENMLVTSPENDEPFFKPHLWNNLSLICFGPIYGGISVDYDTGGNMYAARCSTDVLNRIIIYKSTNAGMSWSYFTQRSFLLGGSPQPVLLTGSTENNLYLFYLNSSQNGDIWMYSVAQDGTGESYEVKVDSDTITYFSACTDLGKGDHLMVVYQKEEMGDDTPDLYTITSTDYGETWSDEVLVYAYGYHPDIAYGRNGYVYLVFEWPGGGDHDIGFIRSTDYCSSGSWVDLKTLTTDSYDNAYPKVVALHTLPDSTPYVWVAYNRENPAGTNIDLGYAYSWNGGKDWSTNHILDSSTVFHEMACDLWTKRDPNCEYVNVCYFKGRYVQPWPHGHIFYGSASATNPTDWGWLHEESYYWPTQSEDGRKICQGTYAQGKCAIIWAGKEPWDDPFGDNFQNLWFNAWSTDVEEEMTEGEVALEFSLSANYPNPFNPTTVIHYTVGSPKSTVRRPIHTTLKIYNVLGRLVRTMVNEPKGAGSYEVIWNGRDEHENEVASGVYFYRLEAENFSQTKKMVLMK